MLKKSLLALYVALTCVSGHATTRYNFFFQAADDTRTVNAYIDWDGSSIVGGGGTLADGGFFASTGITGSMHTFAGTSVNQFTFRVDGYTQVFAVNYDTGGQYSVIGSNGTYVYKVNPEHYAAVGTSLGTSGQDGLVGYVTPLGVLGGDPTAVPEIDGAKLPQVLMLLGSLLLAYRSRKLFKLPHNVAVQAV